MGYPQFFLNPCSNVSLLHSCLPCLGVNWNIYCGRLPWSDYTDQPPCIHGLKGQSHGSLPSLHRAPCLADGILTEHLPIADTASCWAFWPIGLSQSHLGCQSPPPPPQSLPWPLSVLCNHSLGYWPLSLSLDPFPRWQLLSWLLLVDPVNTSLSQSLSKPLDLASPKHCSNLSLGHTLLRAQASLAPKVLAGLIPCLRPALLHSGIFPAVRGLPWSDLAIPASPCVSWLSN